MEYIFLIVAAAWALQFLLSYWQLRRFYRGLAALRRLGRCSVGMSGNRWRGRIYAVLVLDEHNHVRQAALFSGWTIFSQLRPVAALCGMPLEAILALATPVAPLRLTQWLAFQHAAQFLRKQSLTATNAAASPANSPVSA